MSDDFDVITGPPSAPPRIKPSPVPAAPKRDAAADKLAAIPRAPAGAK